MSVISSENLNKIICSSLSIINKDIINHGEITGYILYKMLECENRYTKQELMDFAMLGILHDIGLYKEPDVSKLKEFETRNPWAHSIYGFLFLKYLSPMQDKAENVLYHHLDYQLNSYVPQKYKHVVECLNFADKMDTFMHNTTHNMSTDYFVMNRNIKFSGHSMDLFLKAEAKYHITQHMKDGSYNDELAELFSQATLSESYKRGFLEMLIYSIDFRSEHTVIHTMATVSFARQLGKLMHLNSVDLSNLYYGALLHDIGKIAIPLEILESTSRLSDEEMRTMKAHVRITEMILEGKVNEEVVKIASRHHEKLDGSGYHRGLTEADLTLPQKIVAVADILSALYGKRSYKDSFDRTLIEKILNEDANHHKISREVVDCLFRNYDSVIATFEKEKNETIGIYLKIKEQFSVIMKEFEKFE
ncbi:MAG: HD domain-containing protein [Clostridiales bacterium]|nr:HD domain-containing protein [Clostridiales bacterium]